MKRLLPILLLLFPVVLFAGDPPTAFADLSMAEKKAAIVAMANGECEYKGIPLHGKVEFVESFADIKIEFVESFADIKVKFVDSFPDECGEWQKVTSFPDFKVEVVESFADLKVEEVSSFPGME